MATKRTRSASLKEQGERAAETGAQAAEETVEATERAAENMQQGMRRAEDIGRQQAEQMRTVLSASTKAYQEVADYSKDDMEAMIQSGARLAKGFQEMSWEVMNFTQESLRASLRAANDLMECRSVEDFVAVQRNYLKESVDSFLSESAKLLQMTSAAADEAVNPINQRVEGGRRGANGGQEMR